MLISVFPLLDLTTGQVQFTVDGNWHIFYTDQPQELQRALTRVVAKPQYDQCTHTLCVRNPVTGSSQGRLLVFSLAKFPAAEPLTKLRG